MTTYVIQCAQSPVGTSPSDMTVAFMNTNQCIFAEQQTLLPPMSMQEGFLLAAAIVTVWLAVIPMKAVLKLLRTF
jgi:hypothetical protein